MGIVLKEQGKSEEAIESFNKALSLKPDYADAYNNLGVALNDQGKSEEAIEVYKKALFIKPGYTEAYNNMGNALKEQGKLEEAIEVYKKVLSIRPGYTEVYNNMGNAFKEQGKLEEAIEVYKKALSIRPDYPLACNNMGAALKEQGNLEEAIESYNKALSLKPDYAEAYNNMGVALQEQGKSEEAIESYNKALSLKPNFHEAWNNIIFPLQAMKLLVPSEEELISYYPKNTNSKYSKIAKSILDYKLHLGGDNAARSLSEALRLLANADNIIIKNPTGRKNTPDINPGLPQKVIALFQWGRSGTGLLHSLIDGHPEVSTLPSIYFSEYFDHSTWTKITSGGWSGMIDRFIATYEVLFDASARNPIASKSGTFSDYLGKKEGMANVGEERDEVLRVDKALFRVELSRLMECHDELDAFDFFKLVHAAYDKAINDENDKTVVFYHIHNPDTYAQLNFVRSVPHANWIMMVHEPVQSCESWIRVNGNFHDNNYPSISSQIMAMLFEIDSIIYEKQPSIGVRLEDLKERPRKTIPALCKWMGIKESESLYEMTAQGKKWWGDPTSPDYAKDGMDPFGTASIKRKIGSVFSETDQFILRTLYYPFRVRFGYAQENLDQFKSDLHAIRPLLDELFDFEKVIVERTGADPKKFMKSGSYLYLRSGLIQRWNTLNTFHTYPNMITPLEID